MRLIQGRRNLLMFIILSLVTLGLAACGTSDTSSSSSSATQDAGGDQSLNLVINLDGPKDKDGSCIEAKLPSAYSDLISTMPHITVDGPDGTEFNQYGPGHNLGAIAGSYSDYKIQLPDGQCNYQIISFGVPNSKSYTFTINSRDPITIPNSKLIKEKLKLFSSDPIEELIAVIHLSSNDSNGIWYPAGYNLYDDGNNNIAWKWDNTVVHGCFSGGCAGMKVLLNPDGSGCPDSLYAEVNEIDSTGANIGFSNATSGALSAGGKANLTFQSEQGTAHFTFSKFSCR